MRKKPRHISFAFAVLLFGGCSSWHGFHLPGSSIKGRVVDPQGQAVAGVEVHLGDRLVATTGRKGKFAFCASPGKNRLAVSFSAPKFMSTTRVYDAAAIPRDNTIVIWPRAKPARLRAADGGKLEFDGATIVFPPNVLVDAKGRQVKGDVEVSLSVLDIADPRQLASAPGDFTTRLSDGSIRNLETFGLFELVVADSRGRPVDFAPDRAARVELNVPEDRREIPQSVGSFSFDERSGRWSERSSFDVREGRLVTQVDESDWWNADLVYETTCLQVEVLGCPSGPVKGALVTATGTDYKGAATTRETNETGLACLPVKKEAHVELEVSYENRHHTMRDIPTSPLVVDAASCSSCPLVTKTATHVIEAGFSNDLLIKHNESIWYASKQWNKAPFANTWLDDETHVSFSSSGLTLTLNNKSGLDEDKNGEDDLCDPDTDNCKGAKYASGEYKTLCYHGYGTYTVTITPPAPPSSGIIAGFFTFTGAWDGTKWENVSDPKAKDEIDIELLGRAPITTGPRPDSSAFGSCTPQAGDPAPLIVQTNYHVKGVGEGKNEQAFCLKHGTYTYSFTWTDDSISWSYKDAKDWHLLRTETREPGEDWPTQPGRVYMNLWADSTGAPGTWAGEFDSKNIPRSAVFSDISVPVP